jgi:ubiquitin-protein ligase E3 A
VNFAVNYDNGFGELATAELKPGGADIPVTNANREEYVELYLRQLLNVLPQTKLAEFIGGFTKVIGGEALNLLRPEELQLIVEGSPDLDFVAFEKAAVYEDGFNSESPVIKAFWEVCRPPPVGAALG